jgi:hypothetical protein
MSWTHSGQERDRGTGEQRNRGIGELWNRAAKLLMAAMLDVVPRVDVWMCISVLVRKIISAFLSSVICHLPSAIITDISLSVVQFPSSNSAVTKQQKQQKQQKQTCCF